jgi:FkbM family methyltransferase
MNLKKRLFHLITLQRRSFLGGKLQSISTSLRNALENKINDNELSGEYRILRIFAQSNPMVVFDVGANVGNWTRELKVYSPDSEVYSFEPIPQTFDKLCQNLKGVQKVNPIPIALSDRVGTLEFNFYPSSSYLSSIYKTTLDSHFQTLSVNTITGDAFCDDQHIEKIDFLKIDVEGAENKVLEGFSRRLREKKIKVIQFEYGPLNVDSRFLLKDFYELLEENGYRIGKIYPSWIDWSGYRVEKENFILSNFLAVRSEYGSIFND